jgi:hypothetical protein
MKLQSLKQYVSDTIYQRGKEYYEDDLIENVEHECPDKWSCEIEGSDIYDVEVELNGDEIINWNCDCPYDYGDMCKHVVAFLLYINENRNEHPITIEISEKTTDTTSSELLNNMNEKEMLKFMREYAKKNPEFNRELEKHFLKDTGDYKKEVDDCFKIRNRDLSYNRYDYSNEEEVIANRINELMNKKRIFVKNGQYENAVKTALYAMREIGNCYEEYTDYDGDLASACYNTAEFLSEIIEGNELDTDLSSYITQELGKMLKNDVYDNYSLADIDKLLMMVSLKSSDSQSAIKLLDEALEAEPDSFRTDSLVLSKVELLNDSGKKDEAIQVIMQYLYLPKIRKIRLKGLLDAKLYDKALQLIDEGIKLAEAKDHSGTISDWKDEKLNIYTLTNDTQNIISTAEDLFEKGRDSMKYYHILKQTVSKEDWSDYLQNTLLKKEEKRIKSILPQIYIEETNWDKLMEWAEKNCSLDGFSPISAYNKYLKERYPERMLEFYRYRIIWYAEHKIGRNYYQIVAKILTEMQTFPNGKGLVETLLADFRQKYAKRPAMMEELRKLG